MAVIPETGGDDPSARGKLGRLWSGQVPLSEAFWGCYVFGTFLVGVLTFTLTFTTSWMVLRFLPEASFVAGLADIAFLIIIASYWTIATVGVWRSAGTYSGQWQWAIGARAWVICAGVTGTARIVGRLIDDVSHLFGL